MAPEHCTPADSKAPPASAYRDFLYPLNVFVHILLAEEGGVPSLHYGLFEHPQEPISRAQERSTRMLLERLPPPPARILEVGTGLGTTMAGLLSAGYEVVGVNPDPLQVAFAQQAYGGELDLRAVAFEELDDDSRYDLVLFQESSQYIEPARLFEQVSRVSDRALLLDELAMRPLPQEAPRQLTELLRAAREHRFEVCEDLDLSSAAAPTVDYFLRRIPAHRDRLTRDLGLLPEQVDELLVSGERYRDRYADGTYSYRLLQLVRRE